jgi:cation diffusion facilitator CzcD-associated flavoprotein CzcO
LAYLERTARKHRIADRIRYGSDVAEARFDDATRTWAVTLADGTVLRSRIVVSWGRSTGPSSLMWRGSKRLPDRRFMRQTGTTRSSWTARTSS